MNRHVVGAKRAILSAIEQLRRTRHADISPILVGSRGDQPFTGQPNSVDIEMSPLRTRLVRWAGPSGQLCLLLEESECLLNKGGMVLEDAAVSGVRENAQVCFRQPTRELE
jgi:hypothetical protein